MRAGRDNGKDSAFNECLLELDKARRSALSTLDNRFQRGSRLFEKRIRSLLAQVVKILVRITPVPTRRTDLIGFAPEASKLGVETLASNTTHRITVIPCLSSGRSWETPWTSNEPTLVRARNVTTRRSGRCTKYSNKKPRSPFATRAHSATIRSQATPTHPL